MTVRNGCYKLGANIKYRVQAEHADTLEYMKTLFSDFVFDEGGTPVLTIETDSSLQDEGYILDVSSDGIIIKAKNSCGSFYAVQTLRQLSGLDVNGSAPLKIPCVYIEDAPRFSLRSFMLDISRHFFGMNDIKKFLDTMAMYKMNTFHLHLSDDQGFRIEIKKYPLLTEKGSVRRRTRLFGGDAVPGEQEFDEREYGRGCFFTQEQMREIVRYAASLHISVYPEIDMPGHFMAVLAAYPELSCSGEKVEVWDRFGINSHIACCGNEAVYRFTYDIIDELAGIFPSPYFHIGGDEAPKDEWKKCPRCQKKMKELGLSKEDDLQAYFNGEVEKYLAKKGKTMVGWTEILSSDFLSPTAVFQWWMSDLDGKNVARDNVRAGRKAIVSKCENMYIDQFYSRLPLRKVLELDMPELGLTEEDEKNILGIEAPLWTEYMRDMKKAEFNTFPRLMAVSEIAWSKDRNRDADEFISRLDANEKILDANGIYYAEKEIYDTDKVYSDTDFLHMSRKPYSEFEVNEKIRKEKGKSL